MEILTGTQYHFSKGLLLSGKKEMRPQSLGKQLRLNPGGGVPPGKKEPLTRKMKVLEKEER